MASDHERAKRKARAMLRFRRKQGIYYYLNHSIKDLVVGGWENIIGLVLWFYKLLPFRFIPSPLLYFFGYPFRLLFFLYVSLPLSVLQFFWTFAIAVLHTLSRRNTHTRQMAIHISALGGSLIRIWESVINTKLSEMLLTVLQAIFEVWHFYISNPRELLNLLFSNLFARCRFSHRGLTRVHVLEKKRI